ncbi:MAG TPA: hypothetical protein VF421_10750, partial [Niabella sp.]
QNGWIDSIDGVPTGNMDHEEKEALLAQKRLAVFNEIYHSGGITAIADLVSRLERQQVLGHTAAQSPLSEQDERLTIGWLSVDTEDKKNQFAQSYIWSRSWDSELLWVKKAWETVKNQTEDIAIRAQFFLSISLRMDHWQLLETAEEEVQALYWKKIQPYVPRDRKEENEYVIRKLMDAGRYIDIIDTMTYWCDDLPSELLADILLKAVTTSGEETTQFEHHDINAWFTRLQARNDLDPKTMKTLEWLYLPVFSHLTGYIPKTLHKALTDDPAFFAEVVSYVYMPDEKAEENYTEETLQEYFQKSDSARKLLEGWYGIPGMAEDGTINKDVLSDWVEKAITKGKELNRVYGVNSQLGQLFACYPRKSAETWPPDEICEIMEKLNNETVFSSYQTEIFNSRGVYSKSAYEGGGQERGLSHFFETSAKRIESRYPGTAGTLRTLSRSYLRDAKDEDDRARLNELR